MNSLNARKESTAISKNEKILKIKLYSFEIANYNGVRRNNHLVIPAGSG